MHGSTPQPSCVAYLATAIPSLSETFVYREVRTLRRMGWQVAVASLYPYDHALERDFADLTTDSITVNRAQNLPTLLLELVTHPFASARTLLAATRDAMFPGEPTSAGTRLKLLFQGLGGIYLARQLRRHGTTHLHCHFAHAPTSVGMYAALQLGLPFSFTGHANDLFERRALLRRKLERASFVACISRWHRDFYTAVVPGKLDRYEVVRCGIDVDSWVPREKSPTTERPLQVLTVARLVPKKGIDTLLRALAQTPRNLEVTVAGDGPERAALVSLAQELGCASRVHFLGSVPNSQVRELMQTADAFVLPCRQDSNGDKDGIPVVLMEAMACGLPVISGDLPAIRELIDHGDSGYLVNGDDAPELARLLDALSDDERTRLGAAGRAKVAREFRADDNVAILQRRMASR